MNLVYVPPEDLGSVWEWVRAGLVKTIARTHERYLPEDVYHALRSNTAWLFKIEDIGFVVFREETDPDGKVLYVWVLWVERNAGISYKDEIWSAIDATAAKQKAKRIRWQSPRRWDAWPDSKLVRYVYEREL